MIDLNQLSSPAQCDAAILQIQLYKVELEEKIRIREEESRKRTEGDIVALLDRSDRAVERAILALYNRQTQEEQNSASTNASNGVGFSAFDAYYGTWLASLLMQGSNLYGKALVNARKIAKKYRKQLVEIANQNLARA